MFSDIEKNYYMLLGAYKKIKSYYYYNKNFLFMREKVAKFEYDDSYFEEQMHFLSKVIAAPQKYQSMIDSWIKQVDLYVLPKGFYHADSNKMIIKGAEPEPAIVNKVNFFIDMPIELHILETLWTEFIAKLEFEKGLLSDSVYGNCIDYYVVFNQSNDLHESINHNKNRLFKNYFNQYCEWKNNAIRAVERAAKNREDVTLISLDIKSYFYSVSWDFAYLESKLDKDKYLLIDSLTRIVRKIFYRYNKVLSDYKEISKPKGKTVLPIGMFASMVLANVYLCEFDENIRHLSNVLYYGRYVDDIFVLLKSSNKTKHTEELLFEELLITENAVLDRIGDDLYSLKGYENLVIQKSKVKLFCFWGKEGRTLLNKLKKTETFPSQMNVVPDAGTELIEFDEAAYSILDLNNNTKIRDIGHLEVDKFQLGRHMAMMAVAHKHSIQMLSDDERRRRHLEEEKLLDFFRKSNACEFSSNWINALYFFLVTGNVSLWKRFEINVRDAIRELRTRQIEDIAKGKRNAVKTKLKSNLLQQFSIAVSTALALNLNFCKKETIDIIELAPKIRKANLFNHYLVRYPLINFSDEIDNAVNLLNIPFEVFVKEKGKVNNSRKIALSPRFINMEEVFYFVFLGQAWKGGQYFGSNAESKIESMYSFFYRANNIDSSKGMMIPLSITNCETEKGYNVQAIDIDVKKKRRNNLKIAIANVNLDLKRCCFGLNNVDVLPISFSEFVQLLRDSYKSKNDKVDYLLLPEFYLPFAWIPEVLSFVRKSGITIISGMQYFWNCDNQGKKIARNNVVVFAPMKSGRFVSSCMLVREKNDYAPFEKELLALQGFSCKDQKKPTYSIFASGGVKFGTFLCYEFTDINARALYKNEVDVLFTPEHNKDTAYFSSIIESLVRDLHIFVAQANTSSYGDSRITGPYSRDERNIVQIKGGDTESLIIGTIDLEWLRKCEEDEIKKQENTIASYSKMSKVERNKELGKYYGNKQPKVAKVSARQKW